MFNYELLRNPVNWLIVFLMLAIAVMGFYAITKAAPFGPAG